MTNKWCREKDIDDNERLKRHICGLYLTINYYTGARNKEMLGIRWRDVAAIATESKEDQRINRSIFIPADNAKLAGADTSSRQLQVNSTELRHTIKKRELK